MSCYFYDAAGERTVKLTSESEMVHVNGKKVGGNANICKFTAYVSPYFVVSNGGAYTKHIYAASQRIASKLGNVDGIGADPRRVEQAGGLKKTDNLATTIKARYESLGIDYEEAEKEDVLPDSTMDSEEEEKLIFFYHPDHLGSTSYVTDADGNIAQHVEYIPYGEVFVEERNNSFSTNYLFNAKELDNETGLYYYGARYLDPTGAMWLSVDPVFHAGTSPYAYCLGNPVKMVDPDGEFGVSIHESITRDALAQVGQNLSKRQKRKLVAGSRQADILGFSKPYHFDSDKSNDFAFSRSENRYGKIAERWDKIYSDIENLASKGDFNEEGRMLHNTQDFYAHSNYIELYVKYYVETKGNMIGFDIDKIPTFDEADGDFKNLLKNELKTGEWYGFIKSEKSGLYKKSKLGDDSHYRVNKDCGIRKKSLKGGLIIDGTGNITYFDAARKVALKHTMKLLRKYHGEE